MKAIASELFVTLCEQLRYCIKLSLLKFDDYKQMIMDSANMQPNNLCHDVCTRSVVSGYFTMKPQMRRH